MLFEALSFLPILLLIGLSLSVGVRPAVWVAFACSGLLFFLWGSGAQRFGAALVLSAFSTVQILMILFGALLFYQTMQNVGFIDSMTGSLRQIGKKPSFRFYLMAIGFTAFFEGIAGFGTPGALVPPLLVSMGFPVVASVSAVLLFDGVFAVFGALGTPLLAGLQPVAALDGAQLSTLTQYAAVAMALLAFVLLLGVLVQFRSLFVQEGLAWSRVIFLMLLYTAGMVATSFFSTELPTVLGGLSVLVGAGLFFRPRDFQFRWKAWLPYLLLVLLLLLPGLIPALDAFLSAPLVLDDIGSTGLSAKISPLRSPFLPFCLLSLMIWWQQGKPKQDFGALRKKMLGLAFVLFPSVAVSQFMLHSDEAQASMVMHMAYFFGRLGEYYPSFAPTIGALGTFVTGSSTVSNLLFGASQVAAAEQIGSSKMVMLTLQHLGASLGNAVCLLNIVAAAAVVGLERPNKILWQVLPLPLALLLLLGLAAGLV